MRVTRDRHHVGTTTASRLAPPLCGATATPLPRSRFVAAIGYPAGRVSNAAGSAYRQSDYKGLSQRLVKLFGRRKADSGVTNAPESPLGHSDPRGARADCLSESLWQRDTRPASQDANESLWVSIGGGSSEEALIA